MDADRQARANHRLRNGVLSAELEALLEQGRALFNDGRYFECHEVWETAWKQMEGEDKRVLQGLIQAAAALLHLRRGNLSGARSLLKKSKVKLEAGPAGWDGIELGKFSREIELYVNSAGEHANTKGHAQMHAPLLKRTRRTSTGAA